MEKITFLKQEDNTFQYVWKIVWREDTYNKQKENIEEIEITEEDFEKINIYNCKANYINWILTIEESEYYKNRYIVQRQNNYPNLMDYIDAQVKKASQDPNIIEAGVVQEAEYLRKCLEVKETFPKPI